MIFELIELTFTLVEMALRDVTVLARFLSSYYQLLGSVVSVMFVCLPEAIATVVGLSVAAIVVLKVIQFHS